MERLWIWRGPSEFMTAQANGLTCCYFVLNHKQLNCFPAQEEWDQAGQAQNDRIKRVLSRYFCVTFVILFNSAWIVSRRRSKCIAGTCKGTKQQQLHKTNNEETCMVQIKVKLFKHTRKWLNISRQLCFEFSAVNKQHNNQ